MGFKWETSCYLCKETRAIQHIIGKEPYCDDCYGVIVKKK